MCAHSNEHPPCHPRSESVGDFEDIHFENISIRSAGDTALGMAVMDGGAVRNVTSRHHASKNRHFEPPSLAC